MTIRILSLDFDGCLFNQHYYEKGGNIIQSNTVFLKKIKKENAKFAKTYTFIGSNRQAKYTDYAGFSHYQSTCFPEIKKINDYLETILDTFLLADLYGDLPAESLIKEQWITPTKKVIKIIYLMKQRQPFYTHRYIELPLNTKMKT